MKTYLVFIGCFLFFLSFGTTSFASPDWPAEEGKIIVRFKAEQTPQILTTKAEARQASGKPFTHKVKVWLEDVTNVLKRIESPEKHLEAIEEVDKKIGVAEINQIFTDENVNDIFLVRYSENISPFEASKLYRSLSEVEFAEPDYIYDESGI